MSATTDKLVIPKIQAVALETTQYWEGELAEKAGRIFDIYLYDENWRVHACSFRAMYELWGADVYPENRLGDEDMAELRHQAFERDVSYHATHEIDSLKEKTWPDHMFYEDRIKLFGSPPEDVWRNQVKEKGKQEAHNDLLLHFTQAYSENPLFA